MSVAFNTKGGRPTLITISSVSKIGAQKFVGGLGEVSGIAVRGLDRVVYYADKKAGTINRISLSTPAEVEALVSRRNNPTNLLIKGE